MCFYEYALYAFIRTNLRAHPLTATSWHMHNSYSPSSPLPGPRSRCRVAKFLDSSYSEYFSAPSSPSDRARRENSVGKLQEQTLQGEEDMNVNKLCVWQRERGFIFPWGPGCRWASNREEMCILWRAQLHLWSPLLHFTPLPRINSPSLSLLSFIYVFLFFFFLFICAALVAPNPRSKDFR